MDLWGAFSVYPPGFPAVPLLNLDKEQVEQMLVDYEFRRMEASKHWSKELDIPGYIQACAVSKITFTEWIGTLGADSFFIRYGLPTPIKEALKYESKRIVEEQNRQREEEVAKLKLDNQNPNRHSTIGLNNSTINRFLK